MTNLKVIRSNEAKIDKIDPLTGKSISNTITEAKLSNEEFLTEVARKSENAIGGTRKHSFANNLIKQDMLINGDRGLRPNYYFKSEFGKVFLDVYDINTQSIYDFKFGKPFMPKAQFLKYYRSFPESPGIKTIDRYGNYTKPNYKL